MSGGESVQIDYAALTRAEIAAAVWAPTGSAPRSDYDLNPHMRERRANDRPLRPAAVLCPIVERAHGLSVILTQRTEHLKKHAGQIAFPGGKVDATDPSPMAAALREAREEIGLTAEEVEIAGAIDPYETGTGFTITPFVGFVRPTFAPLPEPGEVAEVFEAPLEFLMNPANHQRMSHASAAGEVRRFYAMPYGERYIWGATAGMLRNLSDRIRAVALRQIAS